MTAATRSLFRPTKTRILYIALLVAILVGVGFRVVPSGAASSKRDEVKFDLFPSKALLPCIANGHDTPTAHVKVERENLNDELTLTLDGLKPGLKFDLFTVQRSNQLANGDPDPAFRSSFGLAWYQSDVQVGEGSSDHDGGRVTIHTILLDQIFGFDPDVSLAPTNTFHVGFYQRPRGRGAVRLPPGSLHAVQRRTPRGARRVHQPAQRHNRPRPAVLGSRFEQAQRLQSVDPEREGRRCRAGAPHPTSVSGAAVLTGRMIAEGWSGS